MSATLAIGEVPGLRKAGVKGPRAAAWLAAQGVAVPPAPNTWSALAGGALIGRLAESEFFLEDGDAPGPAARLAPLLAQLPPGVYPVPRQDACFALSGARLHEALLQVCSVDFQSGAAGSRLFMTSMAGVPVLAIPQEVDGVPSIRIWSDPTFAPYLWRTLSEIVRELKGGCQ